MFLTCDFQVLSHWYLLQAYHAIRRCTNSRPKIAYASNANEGYRSDSQGKGTANLLSWLLSMDAIFLITNLFVQAACSLSLGFGEDSINASAGLVMPMVSSKITGFRGSSPDGGRLFSLKNPGWTKISMDEDGAKMLDTSSSMLS